MSSKECNVILQNLLDAYTEPVFTIKDGEIQQKNSAAEAAFCTIDNLDSVLKFIHECLKENPPTSKKRAIYPSNHPDILNISASVVSEDLLLIKITRSEDYKPHVILDEITDNSPGMLFQLNSFPDGTRKFTYVSKAVEEIYHITREEALEDIHNLLRKVIPEDVLSVEYLLLQAETLDEPIEFTHRVKIENEIRWIRGTARLKSSSPEVRIWTGIIFDITSMKLIEQRALTAEQNAKDSEQKAVLAKIESDRANRSKSNFLANMSHEIRTPMNGIIGFCELALAEKSLEPKMQNYLKRINTSANSLLNIINEILDFSKIEANQLKLESIPFQLQPMLDELHDLFGIQTAKKGVGLFAQMDNCIPKLLLGDPVRIKQILTNLLSNAIKFTESGEIRILIKILEYNSKRAEIGFFVSDTGTGIDPEKIKTILNPFEQGDGSITRKFGGTGLGLSICNRLIKLMGGKLEIESEPGKGSCFSFVLSLPVQQMELSESSISTILSKNIDLDNQRILLVEDRDADLDFLQQLCTSFSLRSSASRNGDEALNLIRKSIQTQDYYNAAILDVKLPGISGIQLAEAIRSYTEYMELPIVFVTAYDMQEIETILDLTKNVTILSKPIKQSALFNSITKVLNLYSPPARNTDNKYHFHFPDHPSILLAEDNEINQEYTCTLLNDAGLEVVSCYNGSEAVELLKSEPYRFAVVLMDMQMPIMDGYEAMEKIRRIPSCETLPIVALTAHAMEGDREKCIRCGASDYLSKPLQPEELFFTIARWIDAQVQKNKGFESTEPAHELPDLPGVNIEEALRRCYGKASLFIQLVTGYAREHSDAHTLLINAINEGDFKSCHYQLHKLKGVAGSMGAIGLFEICRQLESAVLNRRIPDKEQIEDFFYEHTQVLEAAKILSITHNKSQDNQEQRTPSVIQEAIPEEKLPLVKESIEQLENLLQLNDLEAETQFSMLKEMIQPYGYQSFMGLISEALEAFDSEEALKQLESFKTRLFSESQES
jgi:polar amino acid transport system substrate-binding protein